MSFMSIVSSHTPERELSSARPAAPPQALAPRPAPPVPQPADHTKTKDVPAWGEWLLLRLASAAERAFEELFRLVERLRKA